MKRIVLLSLLCILAAGFGTQVFSQQIDAGADKIITQEKTLTTFNAPIGETSRLGNTYSNNTRAIDTTFELNYWSMEVGISTFNGIDVVPNYSWEINADAPCISQFNGTLDYATVVFDTLVSTDPFTGEPGFFPLASSTVTLDTLNLVIAHENNSGTNNVIKVSVYEITPSTQLGQLFEPVAAPVFTDSVVTDTSLSPVGFFSSLSFPVGYTFPQGTPFTVRLDYSGDTSDVFVVRQALSLPCGAQTQTGCPAFEVTNVPSRILSNSITFGGTPFYSNVAYKMKFFQQGACVTGSTPLGGLILTGFDCDGNNDVAEPFKCESSYPMNFDIGAVVTVNVEFNSVVSGDPTEDLCPGDVATVEVLASGGVEPLSYAWSPTNNVSNPFSSTADVTAGNADATYTVTIVDANNDTIYQTVTLDVEAININAGTDQTIPCGTTANLLAVATGSTSGATFSWSNGPSALNNDSVGPGTYTITGTNSFGCTASDNVVVSLAGVSQTLGFTVDGNDPDLTAGQACQNVAVSFTNTSSDLTNWDFNWSYGDGSGEIGIGTDATHPFANTGTFTVTLTADSGTGPTACVLTETASVTVLSSSTSQCLDTTGINDPLLAKLISVYPNPTTGTFVVNFKDITSNDVTVNVYNMIGREVYSNATTIAGSDIQTIDLGNHANGVYLVKIKVGQDQLIKKITLNK